MKKYYQKCKNDCLTAVLATMFQVEPETIPLFISNDEWLTSYSKWLLESHNIQVVQIACNIDTIPFISKEVYYCIGTLKHDINKYSHAVILKNYVDGRKVTLSIWHDPLGDSSPYTIDDLTHIEFFFNFEDSLNEKTKTLFGG